MSEYSYQMKAANQELQLQRGEIDEDVLELIDSVTPYTMTSLPRLFDLYKSIEFIVRAGIPGDILETGVWRGGSMMMAAKTLQLLGDTSRTIYLLDTFEGHPLPDKEKDIDAWGNNMHDQWKAMPNLGETADWGRVTIEEVQANMASTGYRMDKVKLIKGMVEQTAATVPVQRLALLRLDTDWYASSKTALEVFWPKLSPLGFMIADDYGHIKGQKLAVDEFLATLPPTKLTRIDHGCRSVHKLPA